MMENLFQSVPITISKLDTAQVSLQLWNPLAEESRLQVPKLTEEIPWLLEGLQYGFVWK